MRNLGYGIDPDGTLALYWRDYHRVEPHHPDPTRLADTCARLAATQQNLPAPMTVEERNDLRAAAKLLRTHHDA